MRFFGNLLLGENNVLRNRELHISFVAPVNGGQQTVVSSGGQNDTVNKENVGEMSEKQNKILEIIATNKTVSARQLSELLNTTDRTIEREIKK
jgi:predicted HTH transcriptional regulator